MSCHVAGRCGGCPSILQPYAEQLAGKRKQLLTLGLADVPIDVIAEDGLRDRTDLQWRDGVLGMFDLAGAALVDVGPCPALSAPLRKLLLTLAGDPPPIGKMSLRLRVSPKGDHGIWIDAANLDVKTLLDERAWLSRRLEQSFVEIGQRKKPLTKDFKLQKEPELRPWFETYLSGNRTQLLYLPVGGFTQPSLSGNRTLVSRVTEMARASGATRWLELGAGCGNFTLPLASQGWQVRAVEIDGLARAGLERAAAEAQLSVELSVSDMYDPAHDAQLLDGVDAVLADPPRSGLRRFLEVLAKNPPPQLLYVSCFVESLTADAARLLELGYRAVSAHGVDQFPQTPHCEWIVHFRRG